MNHHPASVKPLDPLKFRDPSMTAKGETRAQVALTALETLWINTGTLCNITCANCYIESSPRNDALSYISAAEVAGFLNEAEALHLPLRDVGFTGGEPFMNPEFLAMLEVTPARFARAGADQCDEAHDEPGSGLAGAASKIWGKPDAPRFTRSSRSQGP